MTPTEREAVQGIIDAAERAEAVLLSKEADDNVRREGALLLSDSILRIRKVAGAEPRPCPNCNTLTTCCEAAQERQKTADQLGRIVERYRQREEAHGQ